MAQGQTVSAFDADAFIAGTQVNAALSDKSIPPPAGECSGTITKVEASSFASEKAEHPSGQFFKLRVQWQLDDPNGKIKAVTKRDKNFASQDIFLDLDAGMKLDTREGMNVGLGQLRTAVGQNEAGKAWAFSTLVGASAILNIIHEKRKDSDIVDARVKSVTKKARR